MRAINERHFIPIYLFSVLCVNSILGIQGFDMMDEGWVATGYQQFFNAPDSVQYLFLYYTTQLIGGIWNYLLGNLGLFGLRLFAAITKTLTAYYVYKTLSPYVNKYSIMLGVWLVICSSSYGIFVFHHNHLTALLVTMSIYYILKALRDNRLYAMYVGGIIIGLSIFARLPNMSISALIAVIIVHYYYNRNFRGSIMFCSYYVLGGVTGIAMILLLMLLLGHIPIFMGALHDAQLAASDPDSSHKLSSMIVMYISNYTSVAKSIFFVFFLPCLVWGLEKIRNARYETVHNVFLSIIGLIVIVVAYFYGLYRNPFSSLYSLYALSTVVAILTFYYNKKSDVKYISFMIITNMYLLPLGSDFGIGNMGESCLWLAVPFSIGMIFEFLVSAKCSYKNIFLRVVISS